MKCEAWSSCSAVCCNYGVNPFGPLHGVLIDVLCCPHQRQVFGMFSIIFHCCNVSDAPRCNQPYLSPVNLKVAVVTSHICSVDTLPASRNLFHDMTNAVAIDCFMVVQLESVATRISSTVTTACRAPLLLSFEKNTVCCTFVFIIFRPIGNHFIDKNLKHNFKNLPETNHDHFAARLL